MSSPPVSGPGPRARAASSSAVPRRPAVASGAGLVLAAVVSVQVGAALAKDLFGRLGAPGMVWLRLSIAAAVLVVAWRPWRPWRAGLRWGRRTSVQVVMFGLVIAAMNTTFYQALARVPLGIAVTVEFVGPLALSAALSRRLVDAVSVLAAVAGILMLVNVRAGEHLDLVGVALAATAGGFWAAYILLSARVGEQVPGGSGLAAALVIAGVVTAPAGITGVWGHLTWPSLAAAAGVAVLSSALPWSLELEALRRVPTAAFGILMSVEPAIAALAGRALLHERLLGRQWAGVVVVVAASAAAATAARRDRGEGARAAELTAAGVQP